MSRITTVKDKIPKKASWPGFLASGKDSRTKVVLARKLEKQGLGSTPGSSSVLWFFDDLPSFCPGSVAATSHTAFAPLLPIANHAVNWKCNVGKKVNISNEKFGFTPGPKLAVFRPAGLLPSRPLGL